MTEKMAKSVRLQTKQIADKYPDFQLKQNMCYVVWFPHEAKYSLVDGKNATIVQPNPKVKDDVTVKGSGKGQKWNASVVFIGSKDECTKKQSKLEKVLNENSSSESQSSEEEQAEIVEPKKRKVADEMELEKEADRVKYLLTAMKKKEHNHPSSSDHNLMLKEFETVNNKLDEIKECVKEFIEERKEKRSPEMSPEPSTKRKRSSSPWCCTETSDSASSSDYNDAEFVVKGVNLLKEVPAKNKKPTLYATALLSHLFTDQELREGCVEPAKEGTKRPLDQNKINLLKKCIKVRYGEKTLEKLWGEIRTSLNQKCLDKLKTWRKKQLEASIAE